MSATTHSITADPRFRHDLEEGALFGCGQKPIEEVSRGEEWTWAKWLLIVGIMTFFALGIHVW